MKAGTVGTHLQVVRAKRTLQSEKRAMGEIAVGIGEKVRGVRSAKAVPARAEEQSLIRRGVRAAQRWPQERNARIEELRSLVKSGSYRIDSAAVAECLLNNETHFV